MVGLNSRNLRGRIVGRADDVDGLLMEVVVLRADGRGSNDVIIDEEVWRLVLLRGHRIQRRKDRGSRERFRWLFRLPCCDDG